MLRNGLVPRDVDQRVEPEHTADVTGCWRSLGDGLRFVAREPLLRAFVVLILCTNAIDAARSTVLLPVYAERELVGSLVFGAVGHRLPRRPTFVAWRSTASA